MSAAPIMRDFGAERGITPAVCAMFNVRDDGDSWLWTTRTMNGGQGTRRKSHFSIAPPNSQNWHKYKWVPSQPEGALYLYPPGHSLSEAVKAADGLLYMVGGEVAAMSLMSAGLMNATCTFGDSNVPASLADDLLKLGVKVLVLIPDRDDSGLKWAARIRDLLIPVGLSIELRVLALAYPLETSHGRDVNDWWLTILDTTSSDADEGARLREEITLLKEWKLPEPERKTDINSEAVLSPLELPGDFITAVENRLGIEMHFTATGWTRKPVRCPFHDDAHPSAFWNRHMAILRCQSACGKSYLAKETGEVLGLHMRDYLSATPRIPTATTSSGTTISVVTKDDVTHELPSLEGEPKTKKRDLRPPLPHEAALTDEDKTLAAQGRAWLGDYVRWAQKAAPASPTLFHEAMGMWLLATVATRRIRLMLGGDEIYPNLYVLLVAKTSLYRKTTAMNQTRRLLSAAGMDGLLIPEDNTPEALFDDLAGVKPINFDTLSQSQREDWLRGRAVAAQRSFLVDEASSIFASFRKDYMAGLSELLLKGYDPNISGMRKNLKSRGLVVLKDLSLSFLGATTPVMMAKYMTNEETENGFLARFAIITPDGPPVYSESTDPVGVPASLVERYRRMFMEVLPWHGGQKPTAAAAAFGDVVSPPVMDVTGEPAAIRRLVAYRKAVGHTLIANGKAVDKEASYSRLPTMAIKMAMLLALSETLPGQKVHITEANAVAALFIAERWRESLHRLERDTSQATASRHDQRVLDYLKDAGTNGATLREIKRDCGVRDQRMAIEALTTLADAGLVERYERRPAGPGRPAQCYRIAVGDAS